MHPIQNLLAATDLSAPSRHACERAALLAHEHGAPLTLLHAVSGSALDGLRRLVGAGSGAEQALLDEARRALGALAAELAQRHGVAAGTELVTGGELQEIDAAADRLDADLVVVGARGAGFLRRFVLGSTAERLLRRSRRPLLVVRQSVHEPYRRVLVALDFSPWAAAALALARRVAPQAQFVLLNVFEVPFESKLRFAGVDEATVAQYRQAAELQAVQQLHALAAAAGLRPGAYAVRVRHGEAWLRIVEVEQEDDVDLIVCGKHGQQMVEELLLGSVTRQVLAEAQADVLVSTSRDGA